MYVCMYMYVCVYICMSVYTWMCVYMHMCVYMDVSMCIYVHLYVFVYICIYAFVCIYVCICECIYGCVDVCEFASNGLTSYFFFRRLFRLINDCIHVLTWNRWTRERRVAVSWYIRSRYFPVASVCVRTGNFIHFIVDARRVLRARKEFNDFSVAPVFNRAFRRHFLIGKKKSKLLASKINYDRQELSKQSYKLLWAQKILNEQSYQQRKYVARQVIIQIKYVINAILVTSIDLSCDF